MQLLANLAADGSSPDYAHLGMSQSGRLHLYVAGSLGGGTLTLEAKLPDSSGYVPLQTIADVGLTVLEIGPAALRLTLAGSTTPDVSAWVETDTPDTRSNLGAR